MYTLPSIFLDNEALNDDITAICFNDPDWQKARQQFFETAAEISKHVGFDLYDDFESRFGLYMSRTCDLYYLFGLGLRQELLQALGAEK